MKSRNETKRKKRLARAGAILLLAALAAGGVYLWRKKEEKAAAPQAALRTNAKLENLSTAIVAGGHLQSAEAQEIQVPVGLTIESVAVEAGDTVSAGDVLAVADETALAAQIAQTQNAIAQLDAQMQETGETSDSQCVTGKVAGRVKKIYAKAGDAVADVMAKQGALLILSLDGKMAVQFETTADAAAGSAVTVTCAEGAAFAGTVKKSQNGAVTVTLTDDGPTLGEQATVTDESGETLGEGALYVHQPLEITGASGQVAAVCVAENQWTEANEALFMLADAPISAQCQELLAVRAVYKEKLQELLALADDCAIVASMDGTIESVALTAGSVTSASGSASQENASAETGGSSIPAAGMRFTQTADGASAHVNETSGRTVQLQKLSADFSEKGGVSAAGSGALETVQNGGECQTEKRAGPSGQISAEKTNPSGQSDAEEAGSPKQSFAELESRSGQFSEEEETDSSKPTSAQETTSQSEQIPAEEETGASEPSSAEKETSQPEQSSAEETRSSRQSSAEEQVNAQSEVREDEARASDVQAQESAARAVQENAQEPAAAQNAQESAEASVSAEAENREESFGAAAYSASDIQGQKERMTGFTITAQDSMILSVEVDELDILSVEEGQSAQITMDAAEGKEFVGEVTRVSDSAAGSDGSAKYTVEITLPKEAFMRVGMSASASIVTERRENAVTVLAEAVQERGPETFVYTQYDESSGALSGETKVETGLSDGEKVEILSGLSEGDTVYYKRTESQRQENAQEGSRENFQGNPMDGMFDSGGEKRQMPDGAMPQGMPGGPGGQ